VPSRRVAADVDLPETLSIGVSHRVDPRLRLLADWTWTGWDGIDELRIVDRATGATVTNTALGFKDSWRAGLGAEYALNKPWLLRAGLAYDTTPVRDTYRTPRLPDTDRVWLSIGARDAPGPASSWWLDFGYTHIFMSDGSSNLPYAGAPAAESARGALRGTYRNRVDILAAQVGFRF
jgi:long-chain fatty acid transport protein